MNRINSDIRGQFDFFTELMTGNKIILSKTIRLELKKSNVLWLTGESNTQHETISDDIIFFVERSKRDLKYGIKLRCPSLSVKPFFRFDSDGPAHRNDLPNIALEEQSITTPHFNSFNEAGKQIAYKNETLKKEKEAKIIVEDINFGVSLFCLETKCQLSTGEFPTIIDKEPEFDFKGLQDNGFDNITFE